MSTTNNGNEVLKYSGSWEAQAKLLKERFSSLTDADLKYEPGKESELLSKVEARLHKNREEVIKIINGNQPSNTK